MSGRTGRLMLEDHVAAEEEHSTASSVLRIAIAGGGQMARHHARAATLTGLPVRILAVAEPDTAARRQMLSRCPDARGYEDLPTLLGKERIDVVHVCTPPATHAELARLSLEAGCHVYVEKPFAQSSREARALIDLAAGRGLHVCAGHQLLFEPPALRLQELLPAVGRISHVESFFSFRQVRRGAGGTALLSADDQLRDILPHPVYLLLDVLARDQPSQEVELRSVAVGGDGTIHALVTTGNRVGTLVVTLSGRPVESYLRVVGEGGTLHADFVRGTVQRLLGPGSSGIDKVLIPYRLARQLVWGTTTALTRRVLRRQRSYPGLSELLEAFYRTIRDGSPPPIPSAQILETVRICEEVGNRISAKAAPISGERPGSQGPSDLRFVVTGGTGVLGVQVVHSLLERGKSVRVLSRRLPPPWERIPGVQYIPVDLAEACPVENLDGATCIVHCAAETAGGWEEHRRNSLEAMNNLLRAAARADVSRIVHVSSLAVLGSSTNGRAVDEQTPLITDGRGSGPYVWGKLESERQAVEIGRELGLDIKVVRPGALVDYSRFEPPGRLGRRVGNIFVAVGRRNERLGVADVSLAGRILAWIATHFDEAPAVLNLIEPELPRKRELVRRLRATNPDLRVVWLPRFILHPLSWAAIALQKALRPNRPAISLASVFSRHDYDTSRIQEVAERATSPQVEAEP